MAEKATHRITGRMRNQAFWLTGFMQSPPNRLVFASARWSVMRSQQRCDPRCAGPLFRASCDQLLVLVKAGVAAQHVEPNIVADGRRFRVRAESRADDRVPA